MAISSQAKKVLRRLAVTMLKEPEEASLADFSLMQPFIHRGVPEDLREAVGAEALLLVGDDLNLYMKAARYLIREPEMEHLSVDDVDKELWQFICDLIAHREAYRNDSGRMRAIRDLLDRLLIPWRDFEVLTDVEHLNLRVRELEAMGVTLRHLSREAAVNWGLENNPPFRDFAEELRGRTVAVTTERAGSPKRAAEKAVGTIDDALHMLRVGLVGSIAAQIADEQLLYRRGSMLAVKDVADNRVDHLQWHRLFQPMGFEIRRPTAEPVRRYLEPVSHVLRGDFSETIKVHLRRALHWIGTSITREQYDDKIVDLCTALETLLTVKSDARKGEAVTLRSMLLPTALGQGFLDPVPIYDLYDLRSSIIHGSALRVAGKRHYRFLLSVAVSVVRHFVELVTRDTSITSIDKVIAAIEAPQLLTQAIDWLKGGKGEPIRETLKFARARLQGIQARSR